jgi:FtsP/CotA-like multicopper oxidase with cupredoxin domain
MNIDKAVRFIVVAGLIVMAGTSWGAEFWLRAGATTNTMPDGRQVVMWGFARDSADGAGDGVITVPGPQLNVASNDTLVIHLQNTLPEPVSITIPGQYNYQVLDPVFHSGGAYDGRVRSLTHEAASAGGKATYTCTSVQPGTFLYHSGSHPSVEVQMGLYGALDVVVPGPAVYAGIPINSSVNLLFSEIDPDVHDAVVAGTFGPGPSFRPEDFTNAAAFLAQIGASTNPVAMFVAALATNGPAALADDLNAIIGGPTIYDPALFPDSILSPATLAILTLNPPPSQNYPITGVPYRPDLVRLNRLLLQDGLTNASAGISIPLAKAMTSTIRSYAQYFLINGQSYTNGLPVIDAGTASSTVLLRLLNAGMDAHEPTLNNGGDFRVIGEDGQQLPYARVGSDVFLPALKTLDALWTPPASGTYAVYDRRLGLVNGTQSPGGMLTYLRIAASNAVVQGLSILVPPANDIVFVGQSSMFSVIAGHTGALAYQWQLNGGNIAGATNSSLTIPPVTAANLGNYTVVLIVGAFSMTSGVATLTVVTQPAPVTVADGGSATFVVTNLGPAAITYQWQKDGANIPGATSASDTFTANYATDNGHLYRVVVSGPGGPATSATALLTVTPIAPAIVTQPASTNVPDFTLAAFSVGATGSGLTYQWQRSPTLAGSFVNISGATASTYSFIVDRSVDNNSRYRVVVSRSGASPVTSSAATLTVSAVGVAILTQPTNTIANYGQPASIAVVAQASGALIYQWQKQTGPATWVNISNGGGISGATTATLAFNATATANLANNSTNRVIVSAAAVSGAGGIGATSVTSSTARLTIVITPPTITAQPVNIITNSGVAQVTFTVGATGFPAPTYQWQRFNGASWVNLANSGGFSGVTTPTLTVASGTAVIDVSRAGSYRVNLNNIGGSASATGTLTVIQTFNGSAISTIPLAGGTGTPYPRLSSSVPAFTGSSVKHVTMDLTLTDAEPFDVDALLTTPGTVPARKVQFMGGLGPYQQPHEVVVGNTNIVSLYSYPVTNCVLTFDDAAPAPAPTIFPLYSGTFQPTVVTPTNFPGPAQPYGTNFVTFTGYNQPTAGGWRLYVDDFPQDIPATGADGRISTWHLTLTVGP